MLIEIKNRLDDLAYSVTAQDNFLIEHLYLKVSNEVFKNIGHTNGTEALDVFIIDRVCGLFLKERYLEGKLTDFSEESAVSQISEGDLSISFNEKSSKKEQLFEHLINENFELSPFRSVVW